MKAFDNYLAEMVDNGERKFKQRQCLFNKLAEILPQLRGRSWNTPEEASALYNELGRAKGIMELIKNNPQALQRVLDQWWRMCAVGMIPDGW